MFLRLKKLDMNKWINHIVDHKESRINLFCFPHAGASSAFFAKWGSYFTEQINLRTIQYPMRDLRYQEPMPVSIQEMAQNLAMEGAELFCEPFAFLGHCAGGIIAYETAAALKRYFNIEPAYLVISSAISPGTTHLVSTAAMSDEEFCRHYSVTEDMFGGNEDLMRFFLPIMRADYELCERYESGIAERLECPIFAVCGAQDPQIERIEDVEDWQNYTDGPFELCLTKGDHFYFQNDPGAICRKIEEKLLACNAGYEIDEI